MGKVEVEENLESMNDVHYCPRCETIVIADEGNFGHCTNCMYAFCTLCCDAYHSNSSCDELASKLKKIRKSKDRANEFKSLMHIMKEARKCPSCNIYINRSSGCNKMTCTICGAYFCYSCGKQIKGYDHFNRDPSVRGGCKVFDEVTDDMLFFYANVRRDNNLPDDINVAEYYEQIRSRMKNCPHCGLKNEKMGRNNDISCHHCRNHFCYQCGIKVKGTTHWATSSCKQHSD